METTTGWALTITGRSGLSRGVTAGCGGSETATRRSARRAGAFPLFPLSRASGGPAGPPRCGPGSPPWVQRRLSDGGGASWANHGAQHQARSPDLCVSDGQPSLPSRGPTRCGAPTRHLTEPRPEEVAGHPAGDWPTSPEALYVQPAGQATDANGSRPRAARTSVTRTRGHPQQAPPAPLAGPATSAGKQNPGRLLRSPT